MKFFNNLVSYNCFFFYNLSELDKKISLELSKSFLNSSFTNINIFYFIPSKFINSFFNRTVYNYYMSDVFCLNSKTMMLCARKVRFSLFSENKKKSKI